MIETIKDTSVYAALNLSHHLYHAYLLYSADKELNNNIALAFAKQIVCEKGTICGKCFGCKQFVSHSHPDVIIVNQDSIKVEDASKIINQLSTKPISSQYKVFVILNAENINEIAQNKLLKSLEEPNSSTIFILTSSKTDKLLPTIMSRLHKVYVPKLDKADIIEISQELKGQNINISKYFNTDMTLSDMINFETNKNYIQTLNTIHKIFIDLKSSQDIPRVSSSVRDIDKALFFPLMQSLFISCINTDGKFSDEQTAIIKQIFSKKALIKCLPHIEDAYKKQMSNVNFTYILDNLLFNILKEKFLCKQ
ncbi:MAG: hypothetical protein E7351_03540 [Clostridiales bacterium]|nr:hypothetical protein [Clostridiales bacterium]